MPYEPMVSGALHGWLFDGQSWGMAATQRTAYRRLRACLDRRLLDSGYESKERALFTRGESRADHVALASMERGQKLVNDRLRLRSDVDEEFAAVVRVRHSSDEPAFFECVQDRRHRAGGNEHTLGNLRRLE